MELHHRACRDRGQRPGEDPFPPRRRRAQGRGTCRGRPVPEALGAELAQVAPELSRPNGRCAPELAALHVEVMRLIVVLIQVVEALAVGKRRARRLQQRHAWLAADGYWSDDI